MDIISSPKMGRSLPKPSGLLWEALICEKNIPKPAPNRTKNYRDMLMPLHDIMPSFMNLGRALDLLELKNQVSQYLPAINGAWCLKFIPSSSMGPKHAPKDTDLYAWCFSTNLYAVEHVHIVQIWIMHINALKTQLMHKNFQTNPEKFQNLTQHSYCSMLTLEQKLKSRRGNEYCFVQKGETFPIVTMRLVVRSSGLWEAYIPQLAPNGTIFLPLHVDVVPW